MNEWEWFCGANSTDLTGTLSPEWAGNTCFVHGLAALLHAAFTVIFAVALFLLACSVGWSTIKTKYLLSYPGHTLRWLVTLGCVVVLAASVGEGVLTDQTYRAWHGSLYATQPHLYAPSAAALVALCLSLIYYHHMELWQQPTMSILLLCYWSLALVGEGLRLVNLKHHDQIDINILRFDITMIMIIAYVFLILIELNLIRIKVLRRSGPKSLNRDLQNSNMRFLRDYVNVVSNVSYWWVNWLFAKGYKNPLQHADLGDIPVAHGARHNHNKFKEAFEKEQARAEKKGTRPSMLRIYVHAFGPPMFKSIIFKILSDVVNIISPLCIGALTAYVVTLTYPVDLDTPKPHYVTFSEFFANGFVLVASIFLALTVRVFLLNTHFCITFLEGANMRAAIQTTVYEKALRLATFTTSGGEMTMGQITNHMSADVNNLMFNLVTINYLWSAPFQILIILVQLYFIMGFSALLGASLFFVILPIQIRVATILATTQRAILGCSDQRLKQTNELLQGIKLLKMYAWEQLYCKAIEAVRKKEMGLLLKINICQVISVSITFGIPILVTLVAFATYPALSGESLTPQVTFSSLSFFNLISIPLFMIPMALSTMAGAMASTRRILKFLLASEVEGTRETFTDFSRPSEMNKLQNGPSNALKVPHEVYFKPVELENVIPVSIATQTEDADGEEWLEMNHVSPAEGATRSMASTRPEMFDSETALKITNGNFVWDPQSSSPVLADINVRIPAGKLTMMIGQVGSGKTSLLAAILSEMTTVSGEVHIEEEHGSIAFAAQKPWLLNASMRDNILFDTEMDKKRYNTVLDACALLPDIDILPGGDKTEIGEKGINLSGGQKQRVSVARAMYADRDIIILDDPLSALDVHVGRQLFEEGIMKLLVNRNKTVILVTHQLQYLSRADLIIEMKGGRIAATGSLEDVIQADPETYEEIKQLEAVGSELSKAESAEEERQKLQRSVSIISAEKEKEDGQIVEKEEMVRGSMSLRTYLYLLRSIGWGLVALILLSLALQTSFGVMTNFWLSTWSEAGLSNKSEISEQIYLGGYAGLSIGAALTQVLSTAAVILSFMIAAKHLHLNMLRNIVRVPLRFFDTTLTGRILNRFSNDTQLLDFRLSASYNGFGLSIMQCIASVAVVGVVIPYFLVCIIPIGLVYYLLQRYYLAASRELQRLDSTSKSPVFAYFSETLGGISTIRAYKKERVFYNTILSRIDKNTGAYLYVQIVARWLGVRLDILGALFVLLATGSTLIGALLFGIDPSLVGLSATYSLQMSSYLNYLMRNRAEVELQMNAVERIQHFTDVATEDYGGKDPSSGWPTRGEISIDNISVRYAQGLDAVLTNITVFINAGEKVGICGRTGSGKSSLTLALLRVIDIFQGQILIDGVDIKSVPLTRLRSQISIIPQDPVLFTGPIRDNLDPEKRTSDDELWHALEIAQLKEVVSQLEGGLDSKVTEGGENFSVGQRQLFCLARAFLRKSRILIMDEATASVDMETDKTLQTVVGTAFADRTVLTIAHRIATIRTSDKILVLDGGCLAEYGTPDELLAKPDGLFTALVGDQ